jgi:hypothetical protein
MSFVLLFHKHFIDCCTPVYMGLLSRIYPTYRVLFMSTAQCNIPTSRLVLCFPLCRCFNTDRYMVHSKSPNGPWSEPVRVMSANASKWDGRDVLIDTNLAVTILADNSAVGIWRKCENTVGTKCESECCTFPHLVTASDWRDPTSYDTHSDVRIFPGGMSNTAAVFGRPC